jgi:hypothetical protein
MRASTAEEREALYWKSDGSWYRINEDKECYELTDEAPERAVKSFDLYCRRRDKAVIKQQVTYESICEKLGFRLEEYDPEIQGTECDEPSPFRMLSEEELDFVIDYLGI